MTKTLSVGVLLLGLALGACGSNKNSTTATPDAGGGGNAGNTVTDAGNTTKKDGSAADGGGGITIPPPVTCGTGMCAVPDQIAQAVMAAGGAGGGTMGFQIAAPCCVDPATVACGSIMNNSCVAPPVHDATCDQTVFGMSLAGCCTAAGTCGIDGSTFGQGCVDASGFGGGTPKKCGAGADDAGAADGG